MPWSGTCRRSEGDRAGSSNRPPCRAGRGLPRRSAASPPAARPPRQAHRHDPLPAWSAGFAPSIEVSPARPVRPSPRQTARWPVRSTGPSPGPVCRPWRRQAPGRLPGRLPGRRTRERSRRPHCRHCGDAPARTLTEGERSSRALCAAVAAADDVRQRRPPPAAAQQLLKIQRRLALRTPTAR